ncbi:MAG: EamA family transporter [Candidatus Marinimicrobia bacterium]|jgi:drug/metabolite transporter (DMT)-like permease|nr:EamA family transporter [Candidatus Neomarinimicrobiota bacterium]MBT4154673.1 EamA family transporter [Candidatus Neomarinimicrobiota bacterium]MBT4554581.1 EamA family transporter [Candidatus Neomarinimicrobiota bacterium]MBT4752113.1 EamA family transporter [Candidatus Neomarinimicrobiota bacterium]|tara:strand:+ start:12035 stop:12934 length:900 start_codon:yes stop_codon:yes gene_type:complete
MMRKILPPLAIVFAALLWSLDGFLRQELYSVSSFLVVTLEHALGALLFLPFLIKAWPEIKTLGQRGWISIFWISICGGILGTFFYTKALSYMDYIDLSVVVLLQKLQPLFAISLASIILKEKLSQRFIGLALIAMLGGYLVTFGTTSIADWDDKTIIAALLATLAAFSWGSSTVLGKHALNRLPFATVTALRLSLTAVGALIIFTVTSNGFESIELTSLQWRNLIIIVLSTGSVALFIYYYGLKHLPASHATVYELTWPLSAVFLDWVIRGRMLGFAQIIGAFLLLGSMILLTREKTND